MTDFSHVNRSSMPGIPLYASRIHAGFPSPADDFMETVLDLNELVMHVLSGFSPHMEIYSIDEAWLEVTDQVIDDVTEFGRTIKDTVLQHVGIPVSVGIAPTKCLTKLPMRS